MCALALVHVPCGAVLLTDRSQRLSRWRGIAAMLRTDTPRPHRARWRRPGEAARQLVCVSMFMEYAFTPAVNLGLVSPSRAKDLWSHVTSSWPCTYMHIYGTHRHPQRTHFNTLSQPPSRRRVEFALPLKHCHFSFSHHIFMWSNTYQSRIATWNNQHKTFLT